MKITRRDEEATGSEGAAKWGRWKPSTQEVGLWSSCTKQRVVAALREWGLVTALGLQLMLQLKKHDKHTENLCSRGRNEPQATQVLWSQHDKLSTTLATYENKIPSFLSGSPPPPSFIKAGGYGVWEVLCKQEEREPQPWRITEADKWKTPNRVSGSAEVLFQPMLLLVSRQREERRTVWSLRGYIHNSGRTIYWADAELCLLLYLQSVNNY